MNTAPGQQLVYNNNIKSTNPEPINSRILIPYFSLYSDRIVIHPKPFAPIFKRKISTKSLENLKKKKFTGNISRTQQSVIKKKLTAWLTSISVANSQSKNQLKRKEYYPVFITLTLSSDQCHSDLEIKRKLLDLFIKRIKKNFGVNKYFWRAETQKNGNIHFHLIVDKYCKYSELLKIWNEVQNNLGYIDAFENVFKHRNPNSVDVKSAEKIKNFVDYVLKYCLKDEKNRKIEGRVFGMSDELRNLGVYQSVLDSELSDYMLKYIDNNYFKVYKSDYFTVLFFTPEFYNCEFYKLLSKYSVNYYLKVYDHIYNGEKEKEVVQKPFKEKLIMQTTQLELFSLSDQVKVINHYNLIRSKS